MNRNFVNTSTGITYISSLPPGPPLEEGETWLDTSSSDLRWYVFTNQTWVPVATIPSGPGVTLETSRKKRRPWTYILDTTPGSPTVGDTWFNPSTFAVKIYSPSGWRDF